MDIYEIKHMHNKIECCIGESINKKFQKERESLEKLCTFLEDKETTLKMLYNVTHEIDNLKNTKCEKTEITNITTN